MKGEKISATRAQTEGASETFSSLTNGKRLLVSLSNKRD
jgi:hypothetical protein